MSGRERQGPGADSPRRSPAASASGAGSRPAPAGPGPLPVAIIIPARNEAANLPGCLAAAIASGAAEIVVVDDDSSDATAAIAADIAGWPTGGARRVRVVSLDPLPVNSRWAGKNRACWHGAQLASQPWLLFLDADTRLRPGGLARALELVGREGLAALSLSPEQECGSWAEAAVVPLVFTLLARRFPLDSATAPQGRGPEEAAANGQFFLFQREAYFAVGGHAAVAPEWLEDVALARRLRACGARFAFLSGEGYVGARMYRGLASVWRGWAKNAVPLFGPPLAWPPSPAARTLLVPWALAAASAGLALKRRPWAAAAAAMGLVAAHAAYARRLPRGQRRRCLWLLPGSALFAAIWLDAARRQRRGQLRWKDRPPPGDSGHASERRR